MNSASAAVMMMVACGRVKSAEVDQIFLHIGRIGVEGEGAAGGQGDDQKGFAGMFPE